MQKQIGNLSNQRKTLRLNDGDQLVVIIFFLCLYIEWVVLNLAYQFPLRGQQGPSLSSKQVDWNVFVYQFAIVIIQLVYSGQILVDVAILGN